jgi:AraC-like DNA-binding protein
VSSVELREAQERTRGKNAGVAVREQGRTNCCCAASGEVRRKEVTALVVEPEDRAHLCDIGGPRVDFSFHPEISATLSHLRQSPRPSVVVVEPHDGCGRPCGGLVRQIVSLFPGLPVIGFCHGRSNHAREIMDLVVAGVHNLLFKADAQADYAFQSALQSVDELTAATYLIRELGTLLPGRLRAVAQHCLQHPRESRSVSAVAESLGLNRRTLVNYCRATHFVTPGALISWCQLLLASYYLRSGVVSVATVARYLDIPSATGLRNMLKRYTGFRPCDLRCDEGVQRVLTQLRASLSDPCLVPSG